MDRLSFRVLSYLLIFFITVSDQKSVDNNKMYHDVVSGLGLYNDFKQIYQLTTLNFNETVFNRKIPRTWVVQFYNSWCGHCHRFSPIYKSLAVDIYNWREVAAVGAVDCSNDANNQLCRDYEIMAYPSVKIFPIGSPITFLGDMFTKGTVDEMRLEIEKQVENEDAAGFTRENLNLQPYNRTDLNVIWFTVPMYVQYIVTVIVNPSETPHVGSEVALDLFPVKRVQVRIVHNDNKGLLLSLPARSFPTVYVVERGNTVHYINALTRNRDEIVSGVSSFLTSRGVEVPQKEHSTIENGEFDVDKAMYIKEVQEEIKKKVNSRDLSDVVFQVDLESSLQYSLYHEIGMQRIINGEKLVALKNYLTVLNKYFPTDVNGRKFLQILLNDVLLKDEVHGANFTMFGRGVESEISGVFLPKQDWIGCKGSKRTFRGYPCSLWTMFHTLTVQAYNKQDIYPSSNSQEVLNAMTGYIKNFFGCSECSQHFQSMAVTMPGNVTSLDDSILWLWKAHNSVNHRLAGDITEDPEHRKIQFPSAISCPRCRTQQNEWSVQEVLNFLKSMYTNISYIQESDIPLRQAATVEVPDENVAYQKRLRDENVGEDSGYKEDGSGRSLWGFNVFDISLCVTLYTCSVVILVLVFVKFVVRKNYKKKPMVGDIGHSKV